MPVLPLAFAQRGLLSVFVLSSADLANVVAVNLPNVGDHRYHHSWGTMASFRVVILEAERNNSNHHQPTNPVRYLKDCVPSPKYHHWCQRNEKPTSLSKTFIYFKAHSPHSPPPFLSRTLDVGPFPQGLIFSVICLAEFQVALLHPFQQFLQATIGCPNLRGFVTTTLHLSLLSGLVKIFVVSIQILQPVLGHKSPKKKGQKVFP